MKKIRQKAGSGPLRVQKFWNVWVPFIWVLELGMSGCTPLDSDPSEPFKEITQSQENAKKAEENNTLEKKFDRNSLDRLNLRYVHQTGGHFTNVQADTDSFGWKFRNPLPIPSPSSFSKKQDGPAFTWSMNFFDDPKQNPISASFKHSIFRKNGHRVESPVNQLVRIDQIYQQGKMTMDQLFSSLEGYRGELAQAEDQQETTLQFTFPDFSKITLVIRFQISSSVALPESKVTSVHYPTDASAFVKKLSTEGIDLRVERIMSQSQVPLSLWVHSSLTDNQLVLETYVQSKQLIETLKARPSGPVLQHFVSQQKLFISKLEVEREDGRIESYPTSQKQPWIKIPLDAQETILVRWKVEPNASMPVCKLTPLHQETKTWIEKYDPFPIMRDIFSKLTDMPAEPQHERTVQDQFEVGESIIGARIRGEWYSELILAHEFVSENDVSKSEIGRASRSLQKGILSPALEVGSQHSGLPAYPCQGIFPELR